MRKRTRSSSPSKKQSPDASRRAAPSPARGPFNRKKVADPIGESLQVRIDKGHSIVAQVHSQRTQIKVFKLRQINAKPVNEAISINVNNWEGGEYECTDEPGFEVVHFQSPGSRHEKNAGAKISGNA